MEQPNRIILDATYSLAEAAKLMGLKHPNDVIRLHEKGDITLRMRRVRGVKGRPVLPGAEIVRFNTNLPEKPRKSQISVPVAPMVPELLPRVRKSRSEYRVGKAMAERYDD